MRSGSLFGAALLAGVILASAACGGGASESLGVDEDEVVALGVTTVEVKVSVHEEDIARVEGALGLDADGRVEDELYFFDDDQLSSFARGIVVRARHRKGDSDDATVKLRPVRPGDVPSAYKELEGFKCEGDRAGGKTVVSCSLSNASRRAASPARSSVSLGKGMESSEFWPT